MPESYDDVRSRLGGLGAMALDLLIRFVLGGMIVSAFALIGEVVRPKTFAGLFGAAPSVALTSLGLAFASGGGARAAIETRSMPAGALALCAYSLAVLHLVMHRRHRTLPVAAATLLLWLAVALGLWALFVR
jgi:uncharacterized protein DUF3147